MAEYFFQDFFPLQPLEPPIWSASHNGVFGWLWKVEVEAGWLDGDLKIDDAEIGTQIQMSGWQMTKIIWSVMA